MTQDPNTKDYMMILDYYEHGDLRNYLNKSIDYKTKIRNLAEFARGLLDIHNAGMVHKDLHSGNLLFSLNENENLYFPLISDLGMSQPANISKEKSVNKEGIYGVLPYVAPEVLRGSQYTQAADIYSFGIIMNEFMSEEIPYNDIPHDQILTVKICNGLRPKISEDTPKLIADLIMKCWDAKPENRPTAKQLDQILYKWYNECYYKNDSSEVYSQVKECEKIRENKLKNKSNEDKSKNFQTHPQAIYTSRLLNFKNLPEPVNSSELPINSLNSLDLSSYFSGIILI
jgi:serine/threonine protein kinase